MQCASGVLGWEIKDPGKKVVAKMQARSKKEVKYGYKNGNKNEGLRDCPNRTCLPMKSPLWSTWELVQNQQKWRCQKEHGRGKSYFKWQARGVWSVKQIVQRKSKQKIECVSLKLEGFVAGSGDMCIVQRVIVTAIVLSGHWENMFKRSKHLRITQILVPQEEREPRRRS